MENQKRLIKAFLDSSERPSPDKYLRHTKEKALDYIGEKIDPPSNKTQATEISKPEFQESLIKIGEAYKELTSVVEKHFPDLLPALKTALAVHGCLLIKDNFQPIALFFVGVSGSAKTTVLMFCLENKDFQFRCDNFTPASFVSHAANVKIEKLASIDLLPRIKDKILITKELAPLFRGRDDELVKTFSILTTILDGKGYVSNSGTHGTRGYPEDIFFCWLGATTPFPPSVHTIMGQLGTRIVFFNTDPKENSQEKLEEYAKKTNSDENEKKCKEATNKYLKTLFSIFEKKSIKLDSIEFPKNLLRQLVLYVRVMCRLRAVFSMKIDEKASDEKIWHGRPQIEQPHRAIKILRMITSNLALTSGRDKINEADLSIIRHITLSSVPENRRIVFEALIQKQGYADIAEISTATGMSRPTARKYMQEIGELGLATFSPGSNAESSFLQLKEEFLGLLQTERPEEGEKQTGDMCVEGAEVPF